MATPTTLTQMYDLFTRHFHLPDGTIAYRPAPVIHGYASIGWGAGYGV